MQNRAALEKLTNDSHKAYRDAARGNMDAVGLVRLAGAVLEAEKGAAEQLYPWMEAPEGRSNPPI
jgi:hypothetical protein